MSKEYADNRKELLAGMMYWTNKNDIEIDTAVFFVKLAVEEMVKTNSTREARWQYMKV